MKEEGGFGGPCRAESFFSFASDGRTATRSLGAAARCYRFDQPTGAVLHLTQPGGGDVQGDVLGDLNARRGRVQGTDPLEGGRHRITALVPTAEMQRYAVDLRSLTGGRGRFRAVHDHYDVLPANLADKVARVVPA